MSNGRSNGGLILRQRNGRAADRARSGGSRTGDRNARLDQVTLLDEMQDFWIGHAWTEPCTDLYGARCIICNFGDVWGEPDLEETAGDPMWQGTRDVNRGAGGHRSAAVEAGQSRVIDQ